MNASYANNYVKCWNYQAARKCDHRQNKCDSSVKKLAWFSDSSKLSAHSLPQTTASHLKIRLWRSESECSPCPQGKHKLVNMRWLSPHFPGHAWGGVGDGGFKCIITFPAPAEFRLNRITSLSCLVNIHCQISPHLNNNQRKLNKKGSGGVLVYDRKGVEGPGGFCKWPKSYTQRHFSQIFSSSRLTSKHKQQSQLQ